MNTVPKNTAQVWDKVWSDPGLMKDDQLILAAEQKSIRWRRIETTLREELGNLKKCSAVEIGAGTGTYAALLASVGVKVTLIDYSPKALARAREFFQHNHLPAQFIQADALHLPTKLKTKFDISISIGLTEHFRDDQRTRINQAHLDVLRPGGVAVIVVPNAYNPPYRIFKFISELTGTWQFGEEYPYTRAELVQLAHFLHAQLIGLFGDDLYTSLKFLLPANFLRRLFRVGSARTITEVRTEKGTPLDDYLAYSLILVMKKLKSKRGHVN